MAANKRKSRKRVCVDRFKLTRAGRLLAASSEAETIDRALDFVISECERNHLATEAHERFLRSGIEIKDVYGVLAGPIL